MRKKNFAFKVYPTDKNLSKRWHIDFYFEVDGRVYRSKRFVSYKFLSLAEREKEVCRICAEIETGYTPKPHTKKYWVNNSIKLLYDYLETKTRLRYKSQKSYLVCVRNFEKFCIEKKITVLTIETGSLFLEWLHGSKSAVTVNNNRVFFRSAFAYLKKRRLVQYNCFENTKRLRESQGGANYFKAFQRAFLRDWITENDPSLWLAVQFVYYCFVRPGNELRNLRISDIDLDGGLLTVRGDTSKNGDTERVVIPIQLQNELLKMKLHTYPPQYFLLGKLGVSELPVTVDFWSKRFSLALKESGFQFGGLKYSIYSWKHTGAVLLAQNNVPIIKIQRQLRHKHISTTAKYLKSLGISDMGDLQNSFYDI